VVSTAAAAGGAAFDDPARGDAVGGGALLDDAARGGALLDDATVDGTGAGGAEAAVPPLATLAAFSASEVAGALLVARSSVTFRVDSGAIAARVAGGAAGFGPDSNSGTTNTTSATRIDAPISRSLTRRSITASIFGKRRARQQSFRLEPIERRTHGMKRSEYDDSILRRRGLEGRGACGGDAGSRNDGGRYLAAHLARQLLAASPSSPVERRTPPFVDGIIQDICDIRRVFVRQNSAHREGSPETGPAFRLRASTRAASGLCATSRIQVGEIASGLITWKRPSKRTCDSPCSTAPAAILRRGAISSSAAMAVAALVN